MLLSNFHIKINHIVILSIMLQVGFASYVQAKDFIDYTATATTYQWIDATSGTPIDFPALDDGTRKGIPLGFEFQFYGERFDKVNVCTNGFIGFTTTGLDYECEKRFPRGTYSDYNGEPMVDEIAPLWTDWNLASSSHETPGTGTVYYSSGGTSPDRYLVVEFHNIAHYNGGTNSDALSTFEVVLYESGKIQFNYKQVGFTDNSIVGINYGDGIYGTTTLWRTPPGSNTSIAYNYLTSRAGAISPYIQSSTPIDIPFQAFGNSLASIKLYYKYSSDGNTWGTWTTFGTKSITGTVAAGSFSFNYPAGQGYYQFYTVAKDGNNNTEYIPQLPDTSSCYLVTLILVVSGSSTAPSVVHRGTNNVCIEVLTLSTGMGTITVDSIKLQRAGSCTDADIDLVSLYENDVQISAGSFAAGYATFTGLTISIPPNTSRDILVVYNISATATLGNTIGMKLFDSAWITTSGSVSSSNFPITSGSSLVSQFMLSQELTGVSGASAVWGDYDGDGWIDVLIIGLSSSDKICRVFKNNSGTFSLVADLPGISNGEFACSAAWGDYDNDGDLDIAVTGEESSVIYRNDNGSFTSINANLPGLSNSSIAWGDYDNDGDLDIALAGINSSLGKVTVICRNDNGVFPINVELTGISQGALAWVDYNNDGWLDLSINGESSSGKVTKIYRNKGNGIFEDSGIILPNLYVGCFAWADYDNDGDMDVAITGGGSQGKISRIYRNDNSIFTDINAGLQGVWTSFVAWGDYDNDGFMDLALCGKSDGMGNICNIYRNNGNGSFALDKAISLTGITNGAIAWADYDHDGDIDILLAGASNEGGIARIYRNDEADNNPNNSPNPPVDGFGTSYDSGILTLNWDNGSDSTTPFSGLYYNLRVGTSSGGGNIVSPNYGSPLFGRYYGLKGRTMKLKTVPGETYYWAVQAIDAGLLAGTWSAEQTVVIPNTSYATNTPTIIVTKTVMPIGTQNPGIVLTYTIAYSNTSQGTVTNVVVTDAIPAMTVYEKGTAIMTGQTGEISYSHTNGITFDRVDSAPVTHIRLTIPTVLPSEKGTLQFSVRIR